MKLTKLDRRMTGYGIFKFMVKLHHNVQEINQFIEMRNWCWEQWGPSCEFVFYKNNFAEKNPSWNPAWCWANYEFENRIYLTGDKEGSWFLLKWT